MYRDTELGYATARSQLDALFGGNCDSVVPLIHQISQGKQIAEGDYDGHMTLFTSLIKAEATAKQIDQVEQLNRRDYIGEIAEGRVKHIAKDMWKKDATLQRTVGRKISFVDFKGMILEWIGILSTKRTFMPQTTVRVAASDTSRPSVQTDRMGGNKGQKRQASSMTLEGAKQTQASARCNVCGSAHVTEKCASLLQLSADERVKKLYDHQVCYHCLEKHHIAKFCKNKSKCGVCSKPHHTILHGRSSHPTLSVCTGRLRGCRSGGK